MLSCASNPHISLSSREFRAFNAFTVTSADELSQQLTGSRDLASRFAGEAIFYGRTGGRSNMMWHEMTAQRNTIPRRGTKHHMTPLRSTIEQDATAWQRSTKQHNVVSALPHPNLWLAPHFGLVRFWWQASEKNSGIAELSAAVFIIFSRYASCCEPVKPVAAVIDAVLFILAHSDG